MKYNKIKRWRATLTCCALSVAVLATGILGGCAGIGDVDVTDNEIKEELASGVTMENSGPTDIFEDKNNPENEKTEDDNTEIEQENIGNEPGASETESGDIGAEPGTETEKEPETESEPEQELPDPELEGYPELVYDKAGWGLVYGGAGAQSRGNEKAKTLAEYNAYYIGNAEDKVIYLTFDCGYENGNTDAILNALAEHEVKATFFVTGHFLKKQPDLIKRMVNEGHAVANHSYNHPDISEFTEKEELARELDLVSNKFKEITGTELNMYFRPPEGRCYAKAMKWSKDMGYATIFWSVAHVDWNTSNQPEPEAALKTLLDRTHPGAIVLLHNTSSTNAAILSDLIANWEELGYTIAPLSDLVGY